MDEFDDNQEQEILREIGRRIRSARERAGLTQEELAEKVGRNQLSISQLENAERNLPAADLVRLANALEVSIEYFFGDFVVADKAQSQNLKVLLEREFDRLPDGISRRAAIQLVRTLANTILKVDSH